jgi:hypothetical protein
MSPLVKHIHLSYLTLPNYLMGTVGTERDNAESNLQHDNNEDKNLSVLCSLRRVTS